MKYEVEQKFPLSDKNDVEPRLSALGASFHPPEVQVDQYFNHPGRDFSQTDEALRIRSVGDHNWVTYKGPKVDATTKTRHEIELPLADGEEVAQDFASLLKSLGFTPVAEVRKKRRKAPIDWKGREFEAALDRVDGLGSFLELETSASPDDVEEAKGSLHALAKHLGLGDSERRSYLELLLEEA